MMDRKAEPEIRFKGFTDSWEQRKLSELATFSKGTGYSKADLKENGTPIILYGRLYTKYETIIKDVDTFADVKSGSVYSEGGEVIVPASGETAEDISIASVVEKSGVLLGGDLNIIHPNSNIDPTFLAISVSNGEPHLDMARRAQGKSVVHLHNEDLSQIELRYPSLAEQQKIGQYFSSLDSLITLHQRKCDKLCDFKKALLCNMFPEMGTDTPRVRFKGYTKPWKHWTLGELYTERKESGNDDLPILSVSIHSGVSADELDSAELGKAVRRSEDKSLYKHTYTGDLVFNMMRAWQGAIGVVPKEGMVSPAYITAIPNDEVFPEFMDYCLRREEVINQINNLSYGVTDFRKRLYWDSFVRVQIMLPSVEEQKKITATLVQLDELIELQSAKVKRLKNLKAACLEKMFV